MSILRLRGGLALSAFRLDKLNARIGSRESSLGVTAARFWHFVETGRELDKGERATLDRLLTYGTPAPADDPTGRVVLVTPRPGTISPWSSKATDIAHQCGLDEVRRIERGTAYHVEGAGDVHVILALLHDRMTDAVLASVSEADALFRHVAPKPLVEIDVLGLGPAAIAQANAALGLALAADEIDYLVAYFTNPSSYFFRTYLTNMKLKNPDTQSGHSGSESEHPKDFLWLNIKDLPYFRGLLRAVEAQFYQQADLPAPTLDIGCGDGQFAGLTFDRKIEVGLDPSYESLHDAAGRHTYQLLTEAGGGTMMPYPCRYFSSAFSNSVLEHIPGVEEVLQETARVLERGALFVFCVPNDRFNEQLSVNRFLEKLHLTGLARLYRNFFTVIARHRHLDGPEAWKNRLAAGFVVVKWWHYFPPKSLAVLEWGHYLGLPSLITRKLMGRWIVVPKYWNLMPVYRLLQPYASATACDDGVCTFYITRRVE